MQVEWPVISAVAGILSALIAIARFAFDGYFSRLWTRQQIGNAGGFVHADIKPENILLTHLNAGATITVSADVVAVHEPLNEASSTSTTDSKLSHRLIEKLPPDLLEFADEMVEFEEDAREDRRWAEPKEAGSLLLLLIKTRFMTIRFQRRSSK